MAKYEKIVRHGDPHPDMMILLLFLQKQNLDLSTKKSLVTAIRAQTSYRHGVNC